MMKRTLGILLAVAMTLALMPAFAAPAREERLVSSGTVIDTDGSDGYSGDYVVIYNPTTGTGRAGTGDMTGLIETDIAGEKAAPSVADDGVGYVIDVDGELAEKAREAGVPAKPEQRGMNADYMSFEVGDTHNFVISYYCPLPQYNVQFKVLAKGEHCYIWTPTSLAANVWPLDQIDPGFAQMAADMFDSKFELMQSSFGDHENGSQGDGRLNILYYNIDDGWQPGEGYVAGYFSAYDLYINDMPILNIDTYPGVHSVNTEGVETNDINRSYSTMVHEYQHLINYSQCGYSDTWINECMSAAAEEICFPGSSVCSRIQSWINYRYSTNDDWLTPRTETEYVPEFSLHNGYSMYTWDSNLPTNDLLVLYAQVSLYAQYLYTHFGNTVFHGIIDEIADGSSTIAAIQRASGQSTASITEGYRVALTANTTQDEFDGLYGFILQPGYDPEAYHGVENLYDLLCPVVFTGSSCQIAGGGAICVKPVGGVYNPPAGASGTLKYFGVTRGAGSPVTMGDVDGNGAVNALDALLVLRASLGLVELTPAQQAAADVNGSGDVDAIDALMIVRMSLNL